MAERAKEYSELKKRALLAKQRLKMGYWQKMCDERRKTLEQMGNTGESERIVHDLVNEQVRRDEHKALGYNAVEEEEVFYGKVRAILERDENTLNPIGQVIDRGEFDALDADNKQRYILRLSQKFREMRERYYRERAGKSV
ncbi:MAG: hypothetical protein K2L51_02500 [Clostridiales bacterium]|nr:hypothetical protein [Clostridiales bacterium]